MTSESRKTFTPRVLTLNLTDKIDLSRGEKSTAQYFIIFIIYEKT